MIDAVRSDYGLMPQSRLGCLAEREFQRARLVLPYETPSSDLRNSSQAYRVPSSGTRYPCWCGSGSGLQFSTSGGKESTQFKQKSDQEKELQHTNECDCVGIIANQIDKTLATKVKDRSLTCRLIDNKEPSWTVSYLRVLDGKDLPTENDC